jgi:hypothetical protein
MIQFVFDATAGMDEGGDWMFSLKGWGLLALSGLADAFRQGVGSIAKRPSLLLGGLSSAAEPVEGRF